MREKLSQYANALDTPQSSLEDLNPIQFAAKYGEVDFIVESLARLPKTQVETILKQKTPRGGFTALHYAAYFGQRDCVQILLNFGAEISQVTNLQQLPIQLALINKNIARETRNELFQLLNLDSLLLTYANLNGDNVAHLAAEANLPDILLTLSTSNDKIFNSKNKQGLVPLLVSILNRSMSSTRILMEHNPSLQEKDSKNRNALHYAALFGDIACVSLLLPHFDLKQHDNDGNSAYDYLAKRKDPAFTELLSSTNLQNEISTDPKL